MVVAGVVIVDIHSVKLLLEQEADLLLEIAAARATARAGAFTAFVRR